MPIPITTAVITNGISDFTGVSNFTFLAGTQPFSQDSALCFNISIIDDELVEFTEEFLICGCSEQTGVIILNDGCTKVYIEDNDGM